MPTPTIPNRTVSLGGTRRARGVVLPRDAHAAALLSSRNSRRDQVVFMVTSLSLALVSGQVRAARNPDRPRPNRAPACSNSAAPRRFLPPPPLRLAGASSAAERRTVWNPPFPRPIPPQAGGCA